MSDERLEQRRYIAGIRRQCPRPPAGHYNSFVHRAWPMTGKKWHWTMRNRPGPRKALCSSRITFYAEASEEADPELECKRCHAALVRGDGKLWVIPTGERKGLDRG